MSAQPLRIGMVVPSSNTTMETELPAMCRRIEADSGRSFSFHSSRAVLHQVDARSLDRMVGQLDRCVDELVDARVDAIAYACLVAVMARGPGAHVAIEAQLAERVAETSGYAPAITSSAGAVVRAISALGLERVAIVTPYAPPLTARVADYLRAEGIDVVDAHSRAVTDNVEVGRLDVGELPALARRLDLARADGIVLSACVQMPSLAAIPLVERELGLPVISAATATLWETLGGLGLPTSVPDAGALLGEPLVAPAACADGTRC